jgi:hypothetical protein
MAPTLIFVLLAKILKLLLICSASSRVGAKMRALSGPLVFSSLLKCKACIIGNAKAAVFPVPVWALAKRSRPLRIIGNASF